MIFCKGGGFEKSRLGSEKRKKKGVNSLFAAGVLRDGLGALADCMLAQLSGQVEADGGLDFATGDGVLLVVVRQARSLGGDALEDVVHERVHDAHRLAGDASVRVDLSQDFVDVDGVAFLAGLPLLLLGFSASWLSFCGGGFLLALLGCDFARHDKWFAWEFLEASSLGQMQIGMHSRLRSCI